MTFPRSEPSLICILNEDNDRHSGTAEPHQNLWYQRPPKTVITSSFGNVWVYLNPPRFVAERFLSPSGEGSPGAKGGFSLFKLIPDVPWSGVREIQLWKTPRQQIREGFLLPCLRKIPPEGNVQPLVSPSPPKAGAAQENNFIFLYFKNFYHLIILSF